MLKRLSGFKFGWLQILLGLYLVLMVMSHFNYSSVQVLLPGLKGLFIEGNTETWIGRLWLDSLIPFAFLLSALELIWPYAVVLHLLWCIARAWKTGFRQILRWTFLLRLPLLIILYVSTFAVLLGRAEDLKHFINPSGEVSFTVSSISLICILLNTVADKLEQRQLNKPSLSPENT